MSTNGKDSLLEEIALREKSTESLGEISGKKADFNTADDPGSIPVAELAPENNVGKNSSPKEDGLNHHKKLKDGDIPEDNCMDKIIKIPPNQALLARRRQK